MHIQTFPSPNINLQAPESLHRVTRKWVSFNIKFAAEPTCWPCAACTARLPRDVLIFKQTILKLLTKVNLKGKPHTKLQTTLANIQRRRTLVIAHVTLRLFRTQGNRIFPRGGGTALFRERITRPVSAQFNGLSVSISDLGVRPGIKRIFSGSCAPNQISNFRRPGVTSFHRNRVELRGTGRGGGGGGV